MHKQPTPELCRELLSYIPSRPDYEHWIRIIASVGNTFSETEALQLLLSRFADEKTNEHAHKLRSRLKDVSFGTLVHFAKFHGYTKDISCDYAAQPIQSIKTPKVRNTNFDISSFELSAHTNSKRLFRLAVNRMVQNKTTDYKALTFGYRNETLTLEGISDAVRKGYAISPASMIETDGKIHRKNESFQGSEIILLDMDFSISLQDKSKIRDDKNYTPIDKFLSSDIAKHVALIYTSCSHSETWNRYRLLIPLPHFETDAERYAAILRKYIELYKSDSSRSDVCASFYGNTNTQIFNLITGELC